MNQNMIARISRKIGCPDIVEKLSKLPGSELNSLLLEVFDNRVSGSNPFSLLKQYRLNRFVKPAEIDMVELMSLELRVLKLLEEYHFRPIELSPVAISGSCSILGTVDQKKVISATRNTEVLADATNSIALYIADLKQSRKENSEKSEHLRFCTIQRHVRAQTLQSKVFSPHFKIGCLVSSGIDRGSYQFESRSLHEQFEGLYNVLTRIFGIKQVFFKLQKRNGYKDGTGLIHKVLQFLKEKGSHPEIRIDESDSDNNYYKGIQFKAVIELNEEEFEIADGGFVDWSQQLLGNKKERMLISGFGLELLYKFQNNYFNTPDVANPGLNVGNRKSK